MTAQLSLAILPTPPATRAGCIDGERPCRAVSCRHHLARDIVESGRATLRWADVDEMPATCVLDVADSGKGRAAEDVGYLMNVSRQHVLQIEAEAVAHFRAHWVELFGEGCPL